MRAIEGLARYLDEDDDPDLWRVAVEYILTEIEPGPDLRVEVGRCSHWLRPHQCWWKADGGFAWPTGYGGGGGGYSFRALPQFDWSVVLGWKGTDWEMVQWRSVRTALRLAIPSRTRRHHQAAVHALWHTGSEKEMIFYGFRKRDDGWACTASA